MIRQRERERGREGKGILNEGEEEDVFCVCLTTGEQKVFSLMTS